MRVTFVLLSLLVLVSAELVAVKYDGYDIQQYMVSLHGWHYVRPISHLPGYHLIGRSRYATLRAEELGFSWHEPMVARQQYKRNSYTDPYYWRQWHLRDHATGVGTEQVQHGGGEGVVVAIVDDGLQHIHPDLSPNYQAAWSYDFNDNDGDPAPSFYDGHGTSAAGVCCAAANRACGVGVAPKATLVGLRLIGAATYDYQEAEALGHEPDHIHIYSNSWGPYDDGRTMSGPGRLTAETMKQAVQQGRHGLGSIYVWAGGNGRRQQDNCNYDGYANSRYTIAVGAMGHDGKVAWYSEPCAMLMVVAASSGQRGWGVVTTDLTGRNGYDPGDCTSTFGGTSSAAPLVAGAVAVLLGEYPQLSWRDVQHLLAKAAIQVDANAVPNERGYAHSHDYGFGRVRLPELLEAAKGWQAVPLARECTVSNDQVNAQVPLLHDITVGACYFGFIEHVELTLSLSGSRVGSLTIELTSPSGATSVLAQPHADKHTQMHWRFGSLHHWGESQPQGMWKLRIRGDPGKLTAYRLHIHGY